MSAGERLSSCTDPACQLPEDGAGVAAFRAWEAHVCPGTDELRVPASYECRRCGFLYSTPSTDDCPAATRAPCQLRELDVDELRDRAEWLSERPAYRAGWL